MTKEQFSEIEDLIKSRAHCDVLLARPDALYAFQTDNFSLVCYLKKNIKTVFRLALTDSASPAVITANRILTIVGNKLTQDVINNNLLLTYYTKIFEGESVNEMLAGRFSIICSVTFGANVNLAKESIQIYTKLLDHVHILSVFYFIQAVFIYPDRYSTTRTYIQELELNKKISAKIKETISKVTAKDSFDNIEVQKLMAWYTLIRVGIENEFFSKQFLGGSSVEVLCLDRDIPECVENAKWSAILAFCRTASFEFSTLFYYRAIDAFSREHTKMAPYLIDALDSITCLLDSVKDLIETSFLRTLLRLLMDFPSSTFLQLSVIRFVEKSATIDDINIKVASILVPTLLGEAQIREHGTLWIAAYKIIGVFHTASITRPELKDLLLQLGPFKDFIAFEWKPRESVLNSRYGGEITPIY